MRILGLDIGERRIGVALSDPGGLIARPLTLVQRRNQNEIYQTLLGLIREHGVERIVIGLPRTLRGELGPQAERVRAFSQGLAQRTPIPIEFWDERFSTVFAERLLIQAGATRQQRRGQIDAVSAAFILQGYLDSLARESPGGGQP